MSDLTFNENRAVEHLRQVTGRGIWAQQIQEILREPTAPKIRQLLLMLMQAVRDNHRVMMKILGFDLPGVLGGKIFKVDEINQELRNLSLSYRVISETFYTDRQAEWYANAGIVDIDGSEAICWIDSLLRRIIRLKNGQIFICTDRDLQGMSAERKLAILAFLSGVID